MSVYWVMIGCQLPVFCRTIKKLSELSELSEDCLLSQRRKRVSCEVLRNYLVSYSRKYVVIFFFCQATIY